MMDIRYPSINGATEAAQLQQLKSYLYHKSFAKKVIFISW